MRRALEEILELFREVSGLVVHTSAGKVSVTRDFARSCDTFFRRSGARISRFLV
jgi:hypothetical protein